MEMFVVLKVTPDHVIDAAQDLVRETIPTKVKHLPRRERRRVRDARKQGRKQIAFLEDARESIDARKWARKNIGQGQATHDNAAHGVRVPYPLEVPFLEVDTGERKRRRIVRVPVPEPVPILDEGASLEVEAAYSAMLRQWDSMASKAQRDDADDSDWFSKYAHRQ